MSRDDTHGEGQPSGDDQSELAAIVRESPDGGSGSPGRGRWRTPASIIVAFAVGLTAGVLVTRAETPEDPDVAAMCTTLEVFDDEDLRVGAAALEDPTWARLQVLISSARAAGRADESLQDLADAGNQLDYALHSGEWDAFDEQLAPMREHC